MPTVHIFDIDVTIADCSHRAQLLEQTCVVCLAVKPLPMNSPCSVCCMPTRSRVSEQSWNAFFDPELMYQDPVIPPALVHANKLRKAGEEIHFLTSRSEVSRDVTTRWLTDKFDLSQEREQLFMRPLDQEGVPSSVYKERQLHKMSVVLSRPLDSTLYYFYEDDARVISTYRKYGVVIQCPQAWEHINPELEVSVETGWEIPHIGVR